MPRPRTSSRRTAASDAFAGSPLRADEDLKTAAVAYGVEWTDALEAQRLHRSERTGIERRHSHSKCRRRKPLAPEGQSGRNGLAAEPLADKLWPQRPAGVECLVVVVPARYLPPGRTSEFQRACLLR
jgi:hypothetical protein